MSRPAAGPGLPPPGEQLPAPSDEELERMRAAIAAHGCELLD